MKEKEMEEKLKKANAQFLEQEYGGAAKAESKADNGEQSSSEESSDSVSDGSPSSIAK